MNPSPIGEGDCNTRPAPNRRFIHTLSTGPLSLVDNLQKLIHTAVELSTEIVDNFSRMWISSRMGSQNKHTIANKLWITLWIRGVKTVDNPVDNFVDSGRLWISRGFIHRISTGIGRLSTVLSTGEGGSFGLG